MAVKAKINWHLSSAKKKWKNSLSYYSTNFFMGGGGKLLPNKCLLPRNKTSNAHICKGFFHCEGFSAILMTSMLLYLCYRLLLIQRRCKLKSLQDSVATSAISKHNVWGTQGENLHNWQVCLRFSLPHNLIFPTLVSSFQYPSDM